MVDELNSNMNAKTAFAGDIGSYPGDLYTVEQACGAAWDNLAVTDKPVTGRFSNNGYVMFLAYKYGGGMNGMMMAMKYNSNSLYTLIVVSGTKYTSTISPR